MDSMEHTQLDKTPHLLTGKSSWTVRWLYVEKLSMDKQAIRACSERAVTLDPKFIFLVRLKLHPSLQAKKTSQSMQCLSRLALVRRNLTLIITLSPHLIDPSLTILPH